MLSLRSWRLGGLAAKRTGLPSSTRGSMTCSPRGRGPVSQRTRATWYRRFAAARASPPDRHARRGCRSRLLRRRDPSTLWPRRGEGWRSPHMQRWCRQEVGKRRIGNCAEGDVCSFSLLVHSLGAEWLRAAPAGKCENRSHRALRETPRSCARRTSPADDGERKWDSSSHERPLVAPRPKVMCLADAG
jgi:hypothetical protein